MMTNEHSMVGSNSYAKVKIFKYIGSLLEEGRSAFKMLTGKLTRKRLLGWPRNR